MFLFRIIRFSGFLGKKASVFSTENDLYVLCRKYFGFWKPFSRECFKAPLDNYTLGVELVWLWRIRRQFTFFNNKNPQSRIAKRFQNPKYYLLKMTSIFSVDYTWDSENIFWSEFGFRTPERFLVMFSFKTIRFSGFFLTKKASVLSTQNGRYVLCREISGFKNLFQEKVLKL